MVASRQAVLALIEDLHTKYNVAYENIAIGGFSQVPSFLWFTMTLIHFFK